MQSVNGAQFLNSIDILLLFAATATAVFGAFKVPLTNIYTLLSSHKLDFSIIVLN